MPHMSDWLSMAGLVGRAGLNRIGACFGIRILLLALAAGTTGGLHAEIVFDNGFEAGESDWGENGPWQLATQSSVVKVSSIAREGGQSAHFFPCPMGKRSELVTSSREGRFDWEKEYWVGFSLMVLKHPMGNKIISQHHCVPGKGDDGKPDWSVGAGGVSFALRASDGRFFLYTSTDPTKTHHNATGLRGATTNRVKTYAGAYKLNRWYDFVLHFRYALDDTGVMEVWVNGMKRLDINGAPTVYAYDFGGREMSRWQYQKIGNYHGPIHHEGELLYDAFRIGDANSSYDEVAPRGRRPRPARQMASRAKEPRTTKTRQYCILKADDFGEMKPESKEWENYLRFIDTVKRKKICASLGIIGKKVENPSPEFVEFVRGLAQSGRFEFWNHGYDHGFSEEDAEFSGKSYEYQLGKLARAQDVVRRNFRITMRAFGAPGNRIDATTALVLKDTPDIKVWLYNGDIAAPAGVIGIPERTNIEWKGDGGRLPDFERFKKEYDPRRKVLLCQAHPHRWYKNDDLPEFERSVDFLLDRGVEFILPYDYYKLSAR